MKFINLLITFLIINSLNSASGQKSSRESIDSIIKQAQLYTFEDPVTSQHILYQNISSIRNSKQHEQLALAYSTLAETYLNLSSFNDANRYIDSALTVSKRYRLYKQQIHSLIISSKIDLKKNDKNEFLKKSTEALNLVQKFNHKDEEINIDILIGEFQKTNSNLESSLKYKKKALELATQISNKSSIAESWNSIGSTYWYFSHFQEALEHYYKSYIIRQEIKDTLGTIASLKNLGLTYRDISVFDKAYNLLNQALNLCDKTNNKFETAEVLNLLGSLHYRFNRYNEAILYYKQSLEIKQKSGFLNSTANTLENLARAYSQKQMFNEAFEALNEALKIREQLQDQIGTASTLNEMGNLYNQKGNIAEALRHYLMALKIRQKTGSNEEVAKSFTNIGLTYRKLGLFKNATTYLEQASSLISEGKDPSEAAYILANLGNLYIDQKRFTEALKVFQETLLMRKKTGDEASTAKTYRSYAQVQLLIGQLANARTNYTLALQISKKLNDGKAIADTYNELGNLERQSGNLIKATEYFESALKIYDEAANFEGKALCLRKIGEIQIKQGLYDSAEKNINQSIAIGKEIGNMILVQFGFLAKQDLYKAQNNFKLALEYYAKHVKIRDSLESIRKNEKNLEAQLDLELDKKKEEIKSMESEVLLLRQQSLLSELEVEKQKESKHLIIVLSILTLSIAGLALLGYHQKKRHNQILREKITLIQDINERLLKSEESLKLNIQTKDKLFSIIAHDLKSPFNALVGLTEILSTSAETLSKEEISELSGHINKSSNNVLKLTDNLLNWSRSQTGKIKLQPEVISIKEVVDSCIEVLSMSANEKNISIKPRLNNEDKAYADKDTVTTAIRNILSNAIKFTPNDGEITVWSNKQDGETEIFITDSGVGMSKKKMTQLFSVSTNSSTRGTNQETGTGLGLIICKEFIEKNNGSISVESELNVGTTFTIKLPNQNSKT